MKLNLLPTNVGRPSSGIWAIPVSILLAVAGFALLFYFKTTSEGRVERAKAMRDAADMQAKDAVLISKAADTDLMNARGVILNINMAEAMLKHNTAYTSLYEEVRTYLPGFFRLEGIQAIPSGPESCTVNMTGVLKTYQQYADLQLALLRIPGATAVGRSGFSGQFPQIQTVVEDDQRGRMLYPGKARETDDPMATLDARIANARNQDFDNVGGFGSINGPTLRQNMPEWSQVNVSVVLSRNITVPDPHGTLASSAALWPAAANPANPAGGNTTPASTTQKPTTPTPNNGGRDQ